MTTTKLKIIALIAMFIDHVGQFIPDIPEFFHWIGRIAAPIFIYTLVIGYQHTSTRRKYIIRLYLCSFCMAIFNFIINIVFNDTQMYITNNFFAPLFLTVMTIYMFEQRKIRSIIYFVIWQLLAFLSSVLFSEILDLGLLGQTEGSYQFFGSIFGSVLFVEGGPLFVLLGLFFYLFRRQKIETTVVYIAFSLFCYIAYAKWGHRPDFLTESLLPFAGYQWMMIIALPLMLLYNGKKGGGLKYFFYIFYPVHIFLLYFIGMYLS
jgi:hypothetical protein